MKKIIVLLINLFFVKSLISMQIDAEITQKTDISAQDKLEIRTHSSANQNPQNVQPLQIKSNKRNGHYNNVFTSSRVYCCFCISCPLTVACILLLVSYT